MAAGLHFGNLKSKLNEGTLPFVFGVRNDLHIINLEMTIAHLRRAAHLLRETAMEGGTILFVGNGIYSEIAVKCARSCNSYYLNEFKTGMLAYPWDHLRENNPPEFDRTVAEKDSDNTVAYKIYQDDEL
ncbi:MAG: ribosomal protein S2, flavodoxin-like domain-containing protein, partial [Olpidium bornovanus]